jgi:hypothetical protein
MLSSSNEAAGIGSILDAPNDFLWSSGHFLSPTPTAFEEMRLFQQPRLPKSTGI